MSIKIKMDGKWVPLSTLQDKLNFIEANIPSDREQWQENVDGKYCYTINIDGITADSSVIGLFAYAVEGVFDQLICQGSSPEDVGPIVPGAILVIANSIPTSSVQVNFIHSPSGSTTSICLLGAFMDEQVATLIDQAVEDLPIQIAEDGYTDIKKQRRVTQIDNYLEDGRIIIKYTLEGGKQIEDIINLDPNNLPIDGTANGTYFKINWHGFQRGDD